MRELDIAKNIHEEEKLAKKWNIFELDPSSGSEKKIKKLSNDCFLIMKQIDDNTSDRSMSVESVKEKKKVRKTEIKSPKKRARLQTEVVQDVEMLSDHADVKSI